MENPAISNEKYAAGGKLTNAPVRKNKTIRFIVAAFVPGFLIVTIETDNVDVDLYVPIEQQVRAKVEIEP